MNNDKIKPCIFCKSRDLIIIKIMYCDTLDGKFAVRCNRCGLTGPHKDTESAAVLTWDRLFSKSALVS